MRNFLIGWDDELTAGDPLPPSLCPRGHLMGTYHVKGTWVCFKTLTPEGCAGLADPLGSNRSACRFCVDQDICKTCVLAISPSQMAYVRVVSSFRCDKHHPLVHKATRDTQAKTG